MHKISGSNEFQHFDDYTNYKLNSSVNRCRLPLGIKKSSGIILQKTPLKDKDTGKWKIKI